MFLQIKIGVSLAQAAFAHLREAVALEDGLAYDEPWGWMQPVRHALGALLLQQGHVAEAEAAYNADLAPGRHPENVWSLKGLVDCAKARDAGAAAGAPSSAPDGRSPPRYGRSPPGESAIARAAYHSKTRLAEAEARLARAMESAKADVKIGASCACAQSKI